MNSNSRQMDCLTSLKRHTWLRLSRMPLKKVRKVGFLKMILSKKNKAHQILSKITKKESLKEPTVKPRLSGWLKHNS